MTLQELLTHFEVSRKISPSSYQCKCPVHDDNKASLTISENNGKLLLHCHAGCSIADILAEVGLSFKDLGDHRVPQWKERLEYSQGKRIEAIYNYHAPDGRYLYSKVRFEGKEIRYVTIDQKTDSYQYCKQRNQACLYRLPELIRAVQNGYVIYIVEGEKDVETLRNLGYTATTAGGVKDWRREYASYFTGARIVILPDNDEPGLLLKEKIMGDLKHFAHSIRWTVTSQEDKGDVTDYLIKEGHSRKDLDQLVAAAENQGAPWLYTDGDGPGAKIKINGDILADSIGRGLPYLIVRRPEEDKDDFYVYENGVYVKCNRNKVKSLIRKYVPVGLANDNMINNVYNLLLCRGNNLCAYGDLDADETYINLRNGLYNTHTRAMEPHSPKVRSTIQLQCEYHPEAQSRPVFTRYINDLCCDPGGNVDREKMALLQEFFGLVLSNVKVSRVKVALVLYSALGNTGKTQLLNLIGELLGPDKIANIPIQQMNEESHFSMGNILGKRLISIGDQTSSNVRDSSVFKQLTGGDSVKVEPKNKQPFYITYRGGIVMACNNLPSFQDDKGGHMFERLCIVPCINTIPPERRDSFLLDKMLLEKDAIFNWFLEGFHRLMDQGFKLTRSEACDEEAREYRERMDTVYRYLTEFYIITGNREDMVSKPSFDEAYTAWCQLGGFTPVSKQNIKTRMEANGCVTSKANMEGKRGVIVYRGVKKNPYTGDFQPVTQEEYTQQSFLFKSGA